MKISAIIITYNEEKNIEDCIKSVDWADEIIIIDSNSCDKTIEIASGYTQKIFNFDGKIISEKRKFGLDKTTNDWNLFLDADERISKELKDEITNLNDDAYIDGYYINRKNFYFGKWIQHCGINPDYTLRLFRKSKSKITDRLIHEGVEVNGKCEKLSNSMIHYTVSDLSQLFKKTNYFSTLEAEENHLKNKKISKIGVFTHAFSAFLRIYISNKGYKDKLAGFYVSFSYGFVNFLGHLKLLKLQNKL